MLGRLLGSKLAPIQRGHQTIEIGRIMIADAAGIRNVALARSSMGQEDGPACPTNRTPRPQWFLADEIVAITTVENQ
jgi:hypothetical protein